ncbi:MAG: carboxypeptidase-like regulatory domain-containing protein [Kovacikia sp.]
MVTTWMKLKPIRHQMAIAGQVSDAQTGQVIPGARVELSPLSGTFKTRLALQAMQYGERWEAMTERPDRTHTAIDGSFYFLDLPDGSYTLMVSLLGAGTRYGPTQSTVTVSRQGDRIQRATVDIALSPTTLKGKITNSEGVPVVMAKVQVVGSGESTFSDSQGNYVLTGLEAAKPSGQRMVTVLAQGYELISQGTPLSQAEVKTLDFTLKLKQANVAGGTNGKRS